MSWAYVCAAVFATLAGSILIHRKVVGPWIRKHDKAFEGLKIWALAILLQGILPLIAFVPEYLHTGSVQTKTLGAGSTLYVLAVGLACDGNIAFGMGLFLAFIALVTYGADPSFVNAQSPSSGMAAWLMKYLGYLLIGSMWLTFCADRYYAHVVLSKSFGPFKHAKAQPKPGS